MEFQTQKPINSTIFKDIQVPKLWFLLMHTSTQLSTLIFYHNSTSKKCTFLKLDKLHNYYYYYYRHTHMSNVKLQNHSLDGCCFQENIMHGRNPFQGHTHHLVSNLLGVMKLSLTLLLLVSYISSVMYMLLMYINK